MLKPKHAALGTSAPESLPQQYVSFSDDVPAAAQAEINSRPNWHAFGMLVAWSGAGMVTLLSYVWEVANSLDYPKLALIVVWLLWLAYLLVLARASILRNNFWNVLGPASLFVAWGIVAPLMLWGVGNELQLLRGYPAVEALIVSCVNIFLSTLPVGGVIGQHALFISMASMELWVSSPPTGMMSTATNLMATASNFALGIPACVLLCLAHNRRRTLPSPSAAAAVAGEQQVDTRAVVDTRPTATQSTVVPEGEAKGSAGQGHSLVSTPFGGLAFTTSHPSQSLRPSAQPAPSDLTLLLASMCCNPSLVAWVQRAELWLLTTFPQEDAKFLAAMVSAVFVGTRFLAYVAIYSVPGAVTRCLSPTMDMLGLVLGMAVGASKVPDLKDWAEAHYRSYRSVRGLLRSIIPAHVADALEAYEAQRELACRVHSFSELSGDMLYRQSNNNSKRTSFNALVGASWAPLSSRGRKTSDAEPVGLAKPCPGPSQPWEWAARTWSGNVRYGISQGVPSLFQSAQPRSACLPTGGSHLLDSNSDSENKLGLERRRSFSERHEQVTVLFADIMGFTDLSDRLHPSEVMTLLCDLYKKYDERAEELDLYTVDVIGDCYMCAANLIKPLPNHVSVMVGFARSIIEVANSTLSPLGTPLSIRVGIHTGPLMSGVIGVHRLKFTLLGDTVNVASRMETTAITNTLQISEHAYEQLRREQPTMPSKAAEEQSLDAGECGYWDMDGPSLGEAREQGGCSMVRGNCAPPCLLGSMDAERGVALTELGCSRSSSIGDQYSKALEGQEQLRQRQQGQGQQGGELQQFASAESTPNTDSSRDPAQHQRGGGQQQQQQCCGEQPKAQGMGGQDDLREPQGVGEKCSILSRGVVTASCIAGPAEQSSHTQQPGGQDEEPAHPCCWLERKLNVKGKGIMKAYTYIGP